MRWLVGAPGPSFSVADVYEGWVEALAALGEEVYSYELDRRLQFFDAAHVPLGPVAEDGAATVRKSVSREDAVRMSAEGVLSAAFQAWPQVVLLISAFFVPPVYLDMFRDRGMKVVLLHTESPYQDDEQLLRAAHADLNLVNDPQNLHLYREHGPAHYMPHAYRPSIHHPAPAGTEKIWDFAFVGSGFPSRVRFFEAMDLAGLDVRLAGPWMDVPEDSPIRSYADPNPEGCIDNELTADIYRQSRTGLNLYRREAEDAHKGEGWACGPREIEMASTGLWFARDPRPESDELFPMLPAFTSPEEAGELLRWALAHPEDAEEAAAKARAAVADRTFEAHARKLLAMLEKLG